MGRFSRQAKQSAFLLADANSQSDAIDRGRNRSWESEFRSSISCVTAFRQRAAHRGGECNRFSAKEQHFDRLEIVFHKSHRQRGARALAIPVVDLRDRSDSVSSLNKFFKRVHRAIEQFQTSTDGQKDGENAYVECAC